MHGLRDYETKLNKLIIESKADLLETDNKLRFLEKRRSEVLIVKKGLEIILRDSYPITTA